MTAKEAAQLYTNQGRKAPAEIVGASVSKYHARKKEVDGHMFDSTSEALAYQVLKRWEQAGAISSLELQPRFTITQGHVGEDGRKVRPRKYVADFRYLQDGRLHVVDVKGCKTAVYSLKRAIFLEQYPQYKFEEWTPQQVKEMAQQ
jgi:hypothetical protein